MENHPCIIDNKWLDLGKASLQKVGFLKLDSIIYVGVESANVLHQQFLYIIKDISGETYAIKEDRVERNYLLKII